MAEVIFYYNGNNILIKCNFKEKFKNICKQFCDKTKKDINNLIFIYGGGLIDLELGFNQVANQIDKQNLKMSILVYNKNSSIINQKDKRIIPKDVINKFLKQIQSKSVSVNNDENGVNNENSLLSDKVSDKKTYITEYKDSRETRTINNNQIEVNKDMENLPETFGSYNIKNLKQITTIKTIKSTENNVRNQMMTNNFTQNLGGLDMQDLPETFGSFNMNNFQKTDKNISFKNRLNMKEYPTVFGSSDINNFNEISTTKNQRNNNDIISASTIKRIVDMKDLPKAFGSYNINSFNKKNQQQLDNIDKMNDKQISIQKGSNNSNNFSKILDMEDLPEVFGSSDINNFKQTTT